MAGLPESAPIFRRQRIRADHTATYTLTDKNCDDVHAPGASAVRLVHLTIQSECGPIGLLGAATGPSHEPGVD